MFKGWSATLLRGGKRTLVVQAEDSKNTHAESFWICVSRHFVLARYFLDHTEPVRPVAMELLDQSIFPVEIGFDR
jgi:hypothetical protein